MYVEQISHTDQGTLTVRFQENDLNGVKTSLGAGTFVLRLGDQSFEFDGVSDYGGNQYTILNTGLDWSRNDTVAVTLSVKPVITIQPLKSTVFEGTDTTAGFNLVSDRTVTSALTVNVRHDLTGGYSSHSQTTQEFTLTIPANNSESGAYNQAVEDDDVMEPDGSRTMTILPGTGYTVGTPSSATVTIKDDESLPATATMTVTGETVDEGAAGTTKAIRFFVRLSHPLSQQVTVEHLPGGETMVPAGTRAITNGVDTELITRTVWETLTFQPGETEKSVSATIIGDNDAEPDEIIAWSFGNPSSNATLSGGQVSSHDAAARAFLATIRNDDGAVPLVSIEPVNATRTEGSGLQNVQFRLRVSPASPSALTFTMPAVFEGGDYLNTRAATYTVTVPANTTQYIFNVGGNIINDNVSEAPGTVKLTVPTGTGYEVVEPSSATVTILDDDTATVSISDVSVTEGNGGGRTFMTFTVTLDRAATGNIDFELWALRAPSTADDNDFPFTFTQDTLLGTTSPKFTATGGTSTGLSLLILKDTMPEPDETVVVELRNLTGPAQFAGGGTTLRATGTILNDDEWELPTLTLVGPKDPVVEGDAGDDRKEMTFTARLNRIYNQDVTAKVLVDGLGTSAHYAGVFDPANDAAPDSENDVLVDFTNSFTLTIPAGETEAAISAWVLGDNRPEKDETFALRLESPTNTEHDSTWSTTATVTILDDDATLSVSSPRVREDEGTLAFELSLSKALQRQVTVEHKPGAAGTGTIVNGEDIVLITQADWETLTFDPGETSMSVTVTVIDDGDQEELEETLAWEFRNPVNAVFPDGTKDTLRVIGTIIDNDGVNASANSPPELSRVGFSGEDKDGVYRQRQSGWMIVAGTRFSPGYTVVDRDDAHWDRDDDDFHDGDGLAVEDGAGLKWSRIRHKSGPEPVDVGYGRLVAPNVSAKQVKDRENCMTYLAEAEDRKGAKAVREDGTEGVEVTLCVVPRSPTVILRGLEGWRVKEGKEAHVNAGHSFGGFRPRYQREYDENGKLLPAPDGKKEMHELGLTYAWSQVSGDFSPDMEFPNGANGNQMTFTAPQVERPTVLTFEVTATDSLGESLSEDELKQHQTTRRISYTILDTNDPPVGQGYMQRTGTNAAGCPLYKLDGSGSWDPDYVAPDPANPDPHDGIVSWRFVLAEHRDASGNPTNVLAEVVSDDAVHEGWVPPRVERDTQVAVLVYPTDGKGLEGRPGAVHGGTLLRAADFANCTGATKPGTPPTVDLGPDLDVKSGDEVTLTGRGQAHPDDVTIDRYGNREHDLTYTWTHVSGPQPADWPDGRTTFAAAPPADYGATAKATFVTPLTSGARMVFRLTATDEDGESASDLVAVTVADPDSQGGDPTQLQPEFSLLFADPGPNHEARPGATVTLGPVEAAPEGVAEPATRRWTQLAGPPVTLSDESARNPTFTVPGDASPGTVYEFELEVTDGLGGSAWNVAAVTVLEGTPPTASAGPDLEALPGTTVTLQGRGSTNPHGRWYDMAHRWVQHEGPEVQLSDPTKGDPSFAVPAGAAVGTAYRFVLTVTDEEGETDADSVTVTVVAALSATPPTANAGPDLEAAPGETVTLQGNGSTNPHGKWWRMAHLWTQTKGPDVTLSDPTKGLPSFTVPADAAPGTVFGFELKVTDKDGESDTDAMTVTVPGGVPVTADAGPDLDVEPGATATLGAETDAVEGWTYAWTRASGPEVTLTGADAPRASFAVPADAADGTIYGFALTVTDAHGNTATDVATVRVSATPVLTVEAPSVTEGGPGERTAMTFTLRLDRASTRTLSPPVRVTGSGGATYLQVEDPATATGGDGTDVVGRARADRHAAGAATFAPGATEATLTFTVLGDAAFEEDETLAVEFLPVDGLALPGGAESLVARGTIVNDDTPPVTADAGPDLEVEPGETVTLGVEAEPVEGADWTWAWTQASGPEVTLTGADTPRASFAVPADAADGTIYGFALTVTDAHGNTATDVATATVSATPVLTVEAPSVTEGGPGARTAMTFTLRLDRASTRTLSPRVRVTASGSAAYRRVDDPASAEGGDGTDVEGRARADRHAAGTAIFAPGETEATLTFTVLGDATFEEDETLAVEFLPVDGLALPGGAPLLLVRGTIANDDTAPEATADAGPDLEVAPGATATLGVEAEIPEGADWTHAWTQTSGPEVEIAGADAPQASFAVPADAAGGTAFGFTLTVTDAQGGEATDGTVVTVVRPASACTTELGSLGVGGSADRGGEYWDNPDCSAHHRADRPARYFRFTLTERATVAVDVTTDATAALFVSKGTPKNGWGTPAKAGMAHRLKVRRDNGKLVHGAALSASMVLAAGEYTAEAVLDADGPEAWRVPSFSLSIAATAPPTLSVADARVQEAQGATLSFAVTLDPAAGGAVTVDYATADGTATAGADYEAASGTLTFAAGETSKTVSVTVLDDAHDEGEETLTLTLSNAVGAVLGDAEATGTIANTDAVPEAWLARFGRTVAERHVAAVRSRLDADRSPGFSGRFAGQPLPGPAAGADGTGLGPDPLRESRTATSVSPSRDAVLALRAPAVPEIPELSEDELLAFRSLLADDGEDDPETTALASDDVLLGTSFAMMQDSGTGLSTGFWGSASRSGFSGRDGETDLDGEVTSVMLGTDWKRKGTLFGLMVSGSRGTGTYKGASPGEIDARLTALVPYAGLGIGEGLSAWVAAGTGTGEMTLAPEGADPVTAGIGWSMAAAGAEGDLAPGARLGGADLGWHGDALWTRTTSDAAAGLAASAGDTVRLRLGLQAAWEQTLASGVALRPRLEMGLRHDGGDAETGSGLEIGGGLGIGDQASGLSMSLDGRTLALHEDGAFESWGLGVSVAWDPRPETRRGWSLAARGSLGTTSGGVDALLGPEAFPGLESGGEGDWSVEVAHGAARGYGMVGSPYARTGGSGGPRLGWRVEPDAKHAADASVDFWAGSGTDGDGRGAGAELQWRW